MRMGLSRRRLKKRYTAYIIILLILFYMFLIRLQPAFLSYAHEAANSAITAAINQSVSEVFESYDSYGVHKEDGGVFISDVSAINTAKSDIVTKLQQHMAEQDMNVKIPIGSASGLYLLNGMGPTINVSIIPSGVINTDFEDTFESAGINFVKHTMYITVEVTVHYRGFILNEKEIITNRIPVIENITSGSVPNYYGGNIGVVADD